MVGRVGQGNRDEETRMGWGVHKLTTNGSRGCVLSCFVNKILTECRSRIVFWQWIFKTTGT